MNYHDYIGEMFKHLVAHNTKENVEACADALCRALVGLLCHNISDHDQMHAQLNSLHEQMQKNACELHNQLNGLDDDHEEDQATEPTAVDAETFLRDHFNPERFHG